MITTAMVSFFIGVFGGNAIPHLVKGITKSNYPCLIGNKPVPNFVAGWLMLNITVLLSSFLQENDSRVVIFIGSSLGLLVIGLFHAGPGAFEAKGKSA